MKENGEIEDLKEFDKIMGDPYKGDSFIVITNKSRMNKIHILTCKSIKRSDFIVKVVDNKGKKGGYYWFKDPSEAKSVFDDVKDCENCRDFSRQY